MRTRRPSIDHSEAVARRLAMLSADLDAARDAARRAESGPADPPPEEWDAAFAAGLSRVSVAGVSAAPLTRVAGQLLPTTLAAGPENAAELPELPLPGRHAARRAPVVGPRLRSLVESIGAWAPGQVSVVLVGVVLALAVTCAWLVTGQVSTEVEPVAARAGERSSTSDQGASVVGGTPGPGGGARSEQNPAADVVVDVAGKVKRPGLVVLPAGSRVADALARAGGPRRGADTTTLNLARVLVDGEQLLVGVEPAGGVSVTPPASSPGVTVPGALVSINQADLTQLQSLPGIGPVTAGAIVEWRSTHGGFSDLDDLLEVRGVGEATLARLRPLITL